MNLRSEKEGTCSFVPKQLPFCPRPLSSELLTSWLERVAVANLLSGSMFPFQILLRSLPPEVEAKLWKKMPRWPEDLQARVFAAAAWKLRQNHPFATGKRSSRVHN